MNKKKRSQLNIIAIIVLILIVLSSIYIIYFYNFAQKEFVIINNKKVSVDIADTPKKRKKGLSNKNELCDECGMLFIFDTYDKYGFWMKDMKFDIDIVWIKDNVVVDITHALSHETQNKVVKPNIEVNRVLELPSGYSDLYNIRIGDNIKYSNVLY